MKIIILLIVILSVFSCTSNKQNESIKEPLIENSSSLTIRELAEARKIDIGSAFYYRDGFDHGRYEKEFLSNFNSLTPEDGIIFKLIKPSRDDWNFTVPDRIIEFAYNNNISVKGQHLIWHHYHDNGYLLPDWLLNGEYSKDELIEIMKEFIQTTMTHYKEKYPGTVKWWSVVNEAVSNSYPGQYMKSFWYDNIGPEYIEFAFQFAREADSEAKLYYNDYYIEGLAETKYKSDFSYKIIKELVDKGIPIDGVGMQCHFTLENFPGKKNMSRVIKRYIELGLDVYLTEIDIKIENGITEKKLQKQADYYRALMELVIENQPGSTITTWGFNDAQTYVGEEYAPVLTNSDYSSKPGMNAFRETLIYYEN